VKRKKHWLGPCNAILAIWVVLLPIIFHFTHVRLAAGNSVAVGLVLAAAAFGALPLSRGWVELAELLIGLWFVASPWVLGFNGSIGARTASLVTGSVILGLSIWTLATEKTFSARFHQRDARN
jgi:hypothetical protein